MSATLIAVTGTMSIVVTVALYSCLRTGAEYDRKLAAEHRCKYNDIKGCYERCCAFCPDRGQCKICCKNDHRNCNGYSYKTYGGDGNAQQKPEKKIK